MSKTTIIFEKDQIINDLIRIYNIVPSKPLVPIHDYYLFHVVDMHTCHIYASDATMTIRATAQVQADADNFRFCIPAKLFTETVKLLHEPTFTLTVKDNVCQLKSGKSKFKLPTENPDFFVMIEEGAQKSEVSILGLQFKDAFRVASSFINKKQDTALKNVNLSIRDNKLVVIGGQTVCLSKNNIAPHSLTSFEETSIPLGTAKILQTLFQDKDIVDVYHDGRTAMVSNSSLKLIFTLFVGKYPNTSTLFSRDKCQYFRISTSYLLEAVKRVELYSEEGSYQSIFTISAENLSITTDAPESGKAAEEHLEIISPQEFTVALPSNQLIEVLSSLTDQDTLNTESIRFYMPDTPKKPIIITDDSDSPSREFLISPMMINKPKP
jgi:DNA polymerase-3 subunit beta